MNTLEAIISRHSYRGTYLDKPVPRRDLIRIMNAGLSAPSGCNKQTTSLIAIDDPKVLAQVKAVIDPPVGANCPAMICVLTQKIIAYRDRCFNIHDYSAAIENMLLAIVELGYQSCWYEGHITDTDRIGDKIAKILKVPEGYELICILPVGIAAEPPRIVRKKSFNERAWFNSFGRKIRTEVSCGAIVYTMDAGEPLYAITYTQRGVYGFPQGHMIYGETEQETALREIREETGLNVTLNERFRTFNEYDIGIKDGPDKLKKVIYFLAEFHDQTPCPEDTREIHHIQMMRYDEALQVLQFESARRVLTEADQYIRRHLL